jgi:hypothetical protein
MGTETPPRTRDRQQLIAWASRQKKAPLSAAQATAMDSVYPAWRQTLNGAWFTKLEAVEAFFAADGRFPRAASAEPSEKRIGIWLAAQRAKSELLSAERRKLIDERLPGWNISLHDSRWNQRLDALVEFIAGHDRTPTAKENDKASRTIGVWLNTQRHASDMPDHRKEQLDVKVPGWNRTTEDKWKEEFDFVVAYCSQHGRLPTDHPQDPRITAAAQWVRTQRTNAGNMPQCRVESLDAALPGWRLRNADKWTAMLDYVAEFEMKQGRLPNSKSPDKEEARAGSWLTNQRSGIGVTPEREATLDARLPRWRESAKDRAWHRNLRDTESFYKNHGRRPLPNASDPAEKALGAWYRNNAATSTAKTLTPERKAAWQSAELGDRRTRNQIWNDNLQAVRQFRTEHGRFPFPSGKEPGEERIALWLSYQRNGRIDAERRKEIDTLLPGWDITLRDQWDIRFQECCSFVAEQSRFPSRSGRDSTPQERKLGQWIADQRIPKAQQRGDRIQQLDERLPGWRGAPAG